MVEFVNLTPHEIVVYDESGKNVILRIPPSGQIARVHSEQVVVEKVDGIPVVVTVYSEVEGLPPVCENCKIYGQKNCPLIRGYTKEKIKENTNTNFCVLQVPKKYFIVSSIVAQHVSREDVLAPDTSPDSVVRDEKGRILGVRRFQVFNFSF